MKLQLQSSGKPSVQVVGWSHVGDGMVRVVANVCHANGSHKNHKAVESELQARFDNKLRAVSGSFKSMSFNANIEQITGVMRVNVKAIPVVENMAGFRSVSSNLFMDEEDNMWNLKKTEAGEVLVQNTGIGDHESLRHMMDMCCSSSSMSSVMRSVSSSQQEMVRNLESGSFVSYCSAASNSIKLGFVVCASDTEGKLIVLPQDGEAEEVDTGAVTEEFDTEQLPDVELTKEDEATAAVAAARGSVDISVLLAYYKKVFAYSPDYYQEFARRVQQHAFF